VVYLYMDRFGRWVKGWRGAEVGPAGERPGLKPA